MQVRWGGLGRHTLKAGGPVGLDEIDKYFEVKRSDFFCSNMLLTLVLVVAPRSSHVLCFGRGHQDILDPSLLPHIWSHTMVPLVSGSCVVSCHPLLRRLCACRCLRMPPGAIFME